MWYYITFICMLDACIRQYSMVKHLNKEWKHDTPLFPIFQTDEGGSKRFFQNTWTSFLKARLVCGFPEESLYFNRLHDIYVQHAEDWRDTRVYALFTSSWFDTFPSFYCLATQSGTALTHWKKMHAQHFEMETKISSVWILILQNGLSLVTSLGTPAREAIYNIPYI